MTDADFLRRAVEMAYQRGYADGRKAVETALGASLARIASGAWAPSEGGSKSAESAVDQLLRDLDRR